MAHTDSTRTTIDGLLKYVYAPGINEMVKTQVVTLELMETTLAQTTQYGGRSITIALEDKYMGSTGARGEDGTLPDSTPMAWLNAVVPIYYNYFSMACTGIAMKTTGTDAYAFANAWTREVFGKTKAYRQQLNRQMNGDGQAILAQVDGSISIGGTYTTITLDNVYGISGRNNSDVSGHRFISPNTKVDFYTGSSVSASALNIVSVTPGAFPSTSAYITVLNAGASGILDGDYMYLAGSKGYEMPGMRLLIDDGTVASTFQSLSTSDNPNWKAFVNYGSTPGTAEPWTTNRMQTLIDDIESYGGGSVDAMLTSNAVFFTIGEIMRQQGYVVNPTKLDTGWTVMTFNDKPIYKDPYSLDDIYCIDKSAMKLYEAAPQGWLDLDGMTMRLMSSGSGQKDVYEAYWGWYMTPGVNNRAKVGKMTDITVTVNKK